MVTFVLAGVLGSVLTAGQPTLESDQVPRLPSGGAAATSAPRVVSGSPNQASAPYNRLFTGAQDNKETGGPERLIRFAQKPSSALVVDSDAGDACKPVAPPDQKSIDPGIFMPPRDPQIDFKIRRIVPKGCIDPGIFIPKRKK